MPHQRVVVLEVPQRQERALRGAVVHEHQEPVQAERQAHLGGPIAAALMANADHLLAVAPEINPAEVLAIKYARGGTRAPRGTGRGARYSPPVPTDRNDTVEVWMTAPPRRQSFLVWLVVTIGINMLALIVVDGLFDGVSIERWWPLFIGAAVLGLGNAFLKPVLALLTLPLIVVTFGLAYFFLNVLMLVIAEWIAPDFTIDGFWTYVGATIVIWIVNVIVQSFIGAVQGRVAQPRRR